MKFSSNHLAGNMQRSQNSGVIQVFCWFMNFTSSCVIGHALSGQNALSGTFHQNIMFLVFYFYFILEILRISSRTHWLARSRKWADPSGKQPTSSTIHWNANEMKVQQYQPVLVCISRCRSVKQKIIKKY